MKPIAKKIRPINIWEEVQKHIKFEPWDVYHNQCYLILQGQVSVNIKDRSLNHLEQYNKEQ